MRKDKSGVWQCLLSAAPLIFADYLSAMSKKNAVRGANVTSVQTTAEFLLVKFNHSVREVRRCADNCLTKLMDSFPFLLWNSAVISSALNIIQALSKNIEEDRECRVPTLQIPGLPWRLDLEVSCAQH